MRQSQGRHLAVTRPMRRHRIWPWVLLAIFVLLLAVVGVGGYFAMTMYGQAKEVKSHEQNAMSMLSDFSNTNDLNSLDQVSQNVPQVQSETQQANDIAHGKLWNLAAKAPFIGNDIKTVQGMTSAVDGITHDSVPQFLNVVNNLKGAQLSEGNGQINLQPIIQGQGDMKAADAAMQGQVMAYHRLPGYKARLHAIRDAYGDGGVKLDAFADKVSNLSGAFQVVPGFLGVGHPHHYAILSMTTSEVRPGGGMVGSVGSMTTDNGKITIGPFLSNTAYEPFGSGNPNASEKSLFGPVSYDVRDTAIYPNTQRSAEVMRVIWNKTPWGKKQPIDGLIMLDPVFLQKLISINGDVKLSNGQVLTGSNTAEFLLNTAYKVYTPEQQDVYFAEVATQSLDSMFSSLDLMKLVKIADILGDMTRGRHFQAYSFDSDTEQEFMQNGYTAQTPSSEESPEIGIYVNSQMASKMDWYIHRSTKISKTGADASGARIYHVDYTMTNTMTSAELSSISEYIAGTPQDQRGYGIDKNFFYAPAGGSITAFKVRGNAEVPTINTLDGKTLYTSLAKVAPGSSVTYSFDVTTSAKAVTDLGVDQTPMGWEDPGVTRVNY